MLALGAVLVFFNPITHANSTTPRLGFATFPIHIAGWTGRRQRIDPNIQRVLGADDAIVLDYTNSAARAPVNLFMSYYRNQNHGEATHSPEVCIPGDGWEIRSLKTLAIPVVGGGGKTFSILRAVIQKGMNEALVYFWFEERGRRLTNEYIAKWYILRDALIQGRTDGGLVRLVTPVLKDDGVAGAETRLKGFLTQIQPKLGTYFPD